MSKASPSAPSWLVSTGNFFFRYRNNLFPIIIVLLVTCTRPAAGLSRQHPWMAFGAALAVLGEAIRLLTIGYDYIDRGGRQGKVYASRLVQGGIYSHVRNPMYVGNILIATGLLVFSASPVALLAGIPFFVFVYIAITAAEEAYLKKSFGEDYAAYCRSVPRWLPRLNGLWAELAAVRYDWQKALRKDYGNMYLVAMTLIVLTVWRGYFVEGSTHEHQEILTTLTAVAIATTAYVSVMALKKTHRLG